MTPAAPRSTDRTDLNRAARLIAGVSLAGPAIAELLHPWILRFPAIGAVVAAVEVLWSTYTKARSTPAASTPPPTPTPGRTYLS